jgi:hypothetical protein
MLLRISTLALVTTPMSSDEMMSFPSEVSDLLITRIAELKSLHCNPMKIQDSGPHDIRQ